VSDGGDEDAALVVCKAGDVPGDGGSLTRWEAFELVHPATRSIEVSATHEMRLARVPW
jgi:hypothetical protein